MKTPDDLIQIREAKGLSRDEMATEAGVSGPTIIQAETLGLRAGSHIRVRSGIARAYGIELTEVPTQQEATKVHA